MKLWSFVKLQLAFVSSFQFMHGNYPFAMLFLAWRKLIGCLQWALKNKIINSPIHRRNCLHYSIENKTKCIANLAQRLQRDTTLNNQSEQTVPIGSSHLLSGWPLPGLKCSKGRALFHAVLLEWSGSCCAIGA